MSTYLCSICNCYIANKKDNTYKCPQKEGGQLNFLTFNNIENFKEDQYKRYECFSNIYCNICDQEIGMRIEKDYSLYKSQIMEAPCQINLAIYSLKDELFPLIKLDKKSFQLTFHKLLKKELNNVGICKQINGAIILHQVESRVLLLGMNGLYNDLFQRLWKQTCGNVLLLLYDQNNLNQAELITNLSTQGEQPQIAELYQARNLLFLTPTLDLNNILLKFNAKSYNNKFPIDLQKKEEDISSEKYLLLTHYLEQYKSLDYPTVDDKLILSLIKKSRKQLSFECIIQ